MSEELNIGENNGIKFTLDSLNQLVIEISGKILTINSDFLNNIPKNFDLVNINYSYYHLIMPNQQKIILYMFPIYCFLKNKSVDFILYSDKQLELVLEKYEYITPYYYSQIEEDIIIIDKDKISQLDIYAHKRIEIDEKNNISFLKNVKTIFSHLDNIYKNNENLKNITNEIICPNFNLYYSYKYKELSNEFNYINTSDRISLLAKFEKFINKPKERIYAICGPHGTGKSITSLFIQKYLFYRNISSLYINLKYYLYLPYYNWDEQMETLLKECYFMVKNSSQFDEIAVLLLTKCTNIINALINLNEYILKNNIESILILDQYQNKYDKNKEIIKQQNWKKILVLSSINDLDVKDNLILNFQKLEKSFDKETLLKINQQLFFYDYYETLLDEKCIKEIFSQIKKNKKDTIKEKISDLKIYNKINKKKKIVMGIDMNILEDEENNSSGKEDNNSINEEDINSIDNINDDNNDNNSNQNKDKDEAKRNNINNDIKKEDKKENYEICKDNTTDINIKLNFIDLILQKFAYISKYFFNFINFYDSIYDLLNNEYIKIFKKLEYLSTNNLIDMEKINDLKQKEYLVEKIDNEQFGSLELNKFLKEIIYVPLKYINYKKGKNDKFFFYYSFPLFSKILNDYYNYINSKNIFFSSINGGTLGNQFEDILKIKFRVFELFDIDGYFEVKTLQEMELTNEYTMIGDKYIKSKNNIFINQMLSNGANFDFAIFQYKNQKLILFQSKYIINNNTIKHIEKFKKGSRRVLKKFNELFNFNLNEIYFLYISSDEFNRRNSKDVFKLLDNNKINCLFYSIFNDEFTYNFIDTFKEFKCQESFKIFPKYGKYESQNITQNLEKQKKKVDILNLTYIGRKRKNPVNLDKVLSSFKYLCHIFNYLPRDILSNLGNFENFYDNSNFNIDKITEYVVIAQLNDKSEIDITKSVGFIYYSEKQNYLMDVKHNKNFMVYQDLIEKFIYCTSFFVGKKIKY